MYLITLLAIPFLLTSATFVDLNKPHVTLRRHYRTILRYTTLHHFSRSVSTRINHATSRNDPIGELAQVLQQLHNPTSHRTQLAYSSFYALVWRLRNKQWRHEADQVWATTLESIKQVSTCQHCPKLIDRYLQAYKVGKASVYGSRFGRGRLARKIVDDPRACFLRRPELRRILREMELQLVRMYQRHLPRTLAYHVQGAYEMEATALEKALGTPLDNQEAFGVQVQVAVQNNDVEGVQRLSRFSRFRNWLRGVKEKIRLRLRTNCGCNQQVHVQDNMQQQQDTMQHVVTQIVTAAPQPTLQVPMVNEEQEEVEFVNEPIQSNQQQPIQPIQSVNDNIPQDSPDQQQQQVPPAPPADQLQDYADWLQNIRSQLASSVGDLATTNLPTYTDSTQITPTVDPFLLFTTTVDTLSTPTPTTTTTVVITPTGSIVVDQSTLVVV